METTTVVAFLDALPVALGHTLVVPRRRVAYLTDLDEPTSRDLFEAARLIAHAQVQALGAHGVRLVQSNGRAAGQSVMHCHVHVIPCWSNGSALQMEPAQTCERLRVALQASISRGECETPP